MLNLCGTHWGAVPKFLLLFYKADIRPHLDYGSQLFACDSKLILRKLDFTQFKMLREAMGHMKFILF